MRKAPVTAPRRAPRLRAPAPARRCDAAYYQRLHEQSANYQQANWLLDDLPLLAAAGGRSIVEIGCGNGRFLARAVAHWDDVSGVDWALSPVLARLLADEPRIRFLQQDLCRFSAPRRWDLLVSADVLEHLPPAGLTDTIARLQAAASWGYHRIACYDDGHSHLSVHPAERWLALFEAAAPGRPWRIASRSNRQGKHRKPVAVITNLAGAP